MTHLKVNDISEFIKRQIENEKEGIHGGGWRDYVNCRVKCHAMCGFIIALVTGSAISGFMYAKENPQLFDYIKPYLQRTPELVEFIKNQDIAVKNEKSYNEEANKNDADMNNVLAWLGIQLLGKLKKSAFNPYNELYNRVNEKYKFCPTAQSTNTSSITPDENEYPEYDFKDANSPPYVKSPDENESPEYDFKDANSPPYVKSPDEFYDTNDYYKPNPSSGAGITRKKQRKLKQKLVKRKRNTRKSAKRIRKYGRNTKRK